MCVQFFHMVNLDLPAGVGAPPLNTTSDHLPVFFTLNCSTLLTYLRPILIGQRNSTSDSLSTKINWSKITEDDMCNFRYLLQHNLPYFPAHTCIDPQCSTHKDIIDRFCNQLLVAIDLAAHAFFSKSCAAKLTEFLVGMTKLNLSDKRLSYGTE